jgi:hypothetical protein
MNANFECKNRLIHMKWLGLVYYVRQKSSSGTGMLSSFCLFLGDPSMGRFGLTALGLLPSLSFTIRISFPPRAINISTTRFRRAISESLNAQWAAVHPVLLRSSTRRGCSSGESVIDINSADDQGNTALMIACLCGNELLVKTITDSPDEHPLRVELRNNTGWTAAHWAFSDSDIARRKRVVDMLIARGGKDILIVKDNEGNKPNAVRPKRPIDGSPRKRQKLESMPVPDEDFWRT